MVPGKMLLTCGMLTLPEINKGIPAMIVKTKADEYYELMNNLEPYLLINCRNKR